MAHLQVEHLYSFQLQKEEFKFNILYADPSPLNYIEPVDSSIWPSSIDGKTLLSVFNLDNLNNIEFDGSGKVNIC